MVEVTKSDIFGVEDFPEPEHRLRGFLSEDPDGHERRNNPRDVPNSGIDDTSRSLRGQFCQGAFGMPRP
jgi:hypothetical protein